MPMVATNLWGSATRRDGPTPTGAPQAPIGENAMFTLSRRHLMSGAAGLSLATVAGAPAASAADAAKSDGKDVTRTLARYLVNARYEDLPENVRKEGVRTLLNYAGVAIGGSHHETVDIAVSALAPFSGPPQAGLFG